MKIFHSIKKSYEQYARTRRLCIEQAGAKGVGILYKSYYRNAVLWHIQLDIKSQWRPMWHLRLQRKDIYVDEGRPLKAIAGPAEIKGRKSNRVMLFVLETVGFTGQKRAFHMFAFTRPV